MASLAQKIVGGKSVMSGWSKLTRSILTNTFWWKDECFKTKWYLDGRSFLIWISHYGRVSWDCESFLRKLNFLILKASLNKKNDLAIKYFTRSPLDTFSLHGE